MGIRAHVETKHEIEYGDRAYFNWKQSEIYDWLEENGVDVFTSGQDEYVSDWEIAKETLDNIPEEAFVDIGEEITAEDLRQFVDDLKRAKTGEISYVSWF